MGSAAYVVRNAGDSLSLSFKLLYFGEGGGHLNVASACQLRGECAPRFLR